MARLVLSLSGEGRGHAARALTLLQMLTEHEVMVLSPKSQLEWLAEETRLLPNVRLRCMPSLSFRYHAGGRLSYTKSWLAAAPFIAGLGKSIDRIALMISAFRADLAICDFEPLLPRAATSAKIPLLSLDHQHFLTAIDTRVLPQSLRLRTWFLRPSVKLFCPAADHHLVSSFYSYPQRKSAKNYQQVGVLLRREIGNCASQVGNHLLVYTRRSGAAEHWLEPLRGLGVETRLYGFQHQGKQSCLDFREISATRFLEDLVTCKGLITTAGNQLVGEALAVGKPVLALPEHGNYEQQINGFFVERTGAGLTSASRSLDNKTLHQFTDRLAEFRSNITTTSPVGNNDVLHRITQMLPTVAQKAKAIASQSVPS